jgi:hypothetical protein
MLELAIVSGHPLERLGKIQNSQCGLPHVFVRYWIDQLNAGRPKLWTVVLRIAAGPHPGEVTVGNHHDRYGIFIN